MTAVDRDQTRVARAVRNRRGALDMTQEDLARSAGIGVATLRNLERTGSGQARTLAAVAKALHWTPDSLDRVSRGEEPVEITVARALDDPAVADENARIARAAMAPARWELDQLEARVDRITAWIEDNGDLRREMHEATGDLQRQLAELRTEVAELANQRLRVVPPLAADTGTTAPKKGRRARRPQPPPED